MSRFTTQDGTEIDTHRERLNEDLLGFLKA